jgi:hypothetical protein
MGWVMISDAPAPRADITVAEDQVRQIRDRLGLNISRNDGDLLPELAELALAANDLRSARDAVLVEVRRRGASWKTIAASTGVSATTWRGRHERFTEEE